MDTSDKKDCPDDGQAARGQPCLQVAIAEASYDFKLIDVGNSKLTGQQLLEVAGFESVQEYLLFQLWDDGSLKERQLNEAIELGGKEINRFILFKSDRSFRVEIDGRRFEWGAATLSGLIAKQLVGADPTCTGIWFNRSDDSEVLIKNADTVDLTGDSVERLRTGPIFTLVIEGEEFQWSAPTITAEQIAKLGGWDLSKGVQEVDLATNEVRTLEPDELIELKSSKTFAKKIGWQRG